MVAELKKLEKAAEEIHELARGFGLDFYNMRYELCPSEIIYTFGAYGVPTRFAHWSFGKAFHRMKMEYDYNLSRIYELVINSDPCYAFLLEGNSLIQNKLVIAHVLGHSDFFKNNYCFAHTSRKMMESMEVHARRIREYEFKYGRLEVETFLDAILSIQEHVGVAVSKFHNTRNLRKKSVEVNRPDPYEDLWELDKLPKEKSTKVFKKFPEKPENDLLLFIMHHSHVLEEWQREILAMVREEMLYFWPQITTKILNEGWATYWHTRIMRALEMNTAEVLEFAKMHAGVLKVSRLQINPYRLGYFLLEDIERRWGAEGREKLFEVRETQNDISLIRNYLTEELIEKLDLYLYRKEGNKWVITEKNWEKVREGLIQRLLNGGYPKIVVEDGDYLQQGNLYLKHRYEGVELDIPYLEKTLPYVYLLWGRPVHLETVLEEKAVCFSYDGKESSKKVLT